MSCSTLPCIINSCSAEGTSAATAIEFWQSNDCAIAYYSIINSSGATFGYNEQNLISTQINVQNLFKAYIQTYELTDDITDPKYNTFQNTLVDLCASLSLPGICGLFLGSEGAGASNYCSQFSRIEATNSQILTNLCGCYVPPDENYLKYTLGSPGCEQGAGCTSGCKIGDAGCTGQPACDPLCHRAMTSQKSYVPTGAIITCPQNICAINDVTIKIIGSRVPGGINFNSVCSSCGGANGADGCLCVVSGIDISSTLSDIGIGANYKNFCSADSVAIVTDESGDVVSEMPLSQADPSGITQSYPIALNWGLIIIVGIVLIVLIFLLLRNKSENKPSQKIDK